MAGFLSTQLAQIRGLPLVKSSKGRILGNRYVIQTEVILRADTANPPVMLANDIVRIMRVPRGAFFKTLEMFNDVPLAAGSGFLEVGFYEEAGPLIPSQEDGLADNVLLTSFRDIFTRIDDIGQFNRDQRSKPLYQTLGSGLDPNGHFDIAIKFSEDVPLINDGVFFDFRLEFSL